MGPLSTRRADGLTPGQRRAAVGVIVALHGAAGWGLLQVQEVRDMVSQAAPIFVDMIAAPAPPAPPVPPPAPRAPPKITRAPRVLAAAPSPAPAPFVAPLPEVEQPPAPPVPVAVQAPPAPPEPPAPPLPPKEIPASAVQYLEPPPLEYPRTSRRAGEAGHVVVRVYIDEAGLPRGVQLRRSSGFARLDDAAIAAVQKARFRPYTESGKPTAGWALIPLTFDLEK